MTTKNQNLKESLQKLAEIVRWFDDQKEIDVEAGLEKVRDGVRIVKQSRERLKEIENEFEEIKKDIDKTK